jgi:hypothetical protein
MKAVLKIRQATENNRYVKATFTDSEGKEAKELIQTFRDSDPGELLICSNLELVTNFSRKENGKFSVNSAGDR